MTWRTYDNYKLALTSLFVCLLFSMWKPPNCLMHFIAGGPTVFDGGWGGLTYRSVQGVDSPPYDQSVANPQVKRWSWKPINNTNKKIPLKVQMFGTRRPLFSPIPSVTDQKLTSSHTHKETRGVTSHNNPRHASPSLARLCIVTSQPTDHNTHLPSHTHTPAARAHCLPLSKSLPP